MGAEDTVPGITLMGLRKTHEDIISSMEAHVVESKKSIGAAWQQITQALSSGGKPSKSKGNGLMEFLFFFTFRGR